MKLGRVELLKKISSATLIAYLLFVSLYTAFEPGLARAVSVEDQITITQSVTSSISITSPSNVTMTALTLSQNTAVASTTWTIVTNNSTGYTLSVNASGTPALQRITGGASFADYTGALTPWTVSNAVQFGFSALGTNTTGYGSDPDNNCATAATDVPSTTLGWKGFTGTTLIQVASSSATTTSAGVTTTVCFADQQATQLASSGTYVATTTATATTNP